MKPETVKPETVMGENPTTLRDDPEHGGEEAGTAGGDIRVPALSRARRPGTGEFG